MAKKEQMIFLNDKTILPWGTIDGKTTDPDNFSETSLRYYKASTTPKEYLGPALFQTFTKPYYVIASAMIYAVDLARIVERDEKFGEKYKTHSEVMFVGGIQILDAGVKIKNEWVLNEKIWYAKKMPKTGVRERGLPLILINDEMNLGRGRTMIERIIRGYEFQREKEQKRREFENRLSRR